MKEKMKTQVTNLKQTIAKKPKQAIIAAAAIIAVTGAAVIPATVAYARAEKLSELNQQINADTVKHVTNQQNTAGYNALAQPRMTQAAALLGELEASMQDVKPPTLSQESIDKINKSISDARGQLEANKIEETPEAKKLETWAETNGQTPDYLTMSPEEAARKAGITLESVPPVKYQEIGEAEKHASKIAGELKQSTTAFQTAQDTASYPVKTLDTVVTGLAATKTEVVKNAETIANNSVSAPDDKKNAVKDTAKAWAESSHIDLKIVKELFANYVNAAKDTINTHNQAEADKAAENGQTTYTDAAGNTVGVAGYDVAAGTWVAPAPANWRGTPPATGYSSNTAAGRNTQPAPAAAAPSSSGGGYSNITTHTSSSEGDNFQFEHFGYEKTQCPVPAEDEYYNGTTYGGTGIVGMCRGISKKSDSNTAGWGE